MLTVVCHKPFLEQIQEVPSLLSSPSLSSCTFVASYWLWKIYLIHGYHSQLRLYHCTFPPSYLHETYHLGWPTSPLILHRTRAYEMLIPSERVEFFDVVVALVRRVVAGDVRTGYLGLRKGMGGGEGSEVGVLLVFVLIVGFWWGEWGLWVWTGGWWRRRWGRRWRRRWRRGRGRGGGTGRGGRGGGDESRDVEKDKTLFSNVNWRT